MIVFVQEKSIALKIFELGLKRYADVPEYALCYIEFMSHLNGESVLSCVFHTSIRHAKLTLVMKLVCQKQFSCTCQISNYAIKPVFHARNMSSVHIIYLADLVK